MSEDEAYHVERWRRSPKPARIEPAGLGQESVWSYPRPPSLEPELRRVRVVFAGETVADTTRAMRICETASPPCYYLPPEDVRTDWLERAPGRSLCEWKGQARYHTLRIGDRVAEQAAWSYPTPRERYAAIAGWLAFFAQRVDACYVGEHRVTPQPGGFYGGWITPELVGPFKGAPGSEGW